MTIPAAIKGSYAHFQLVPTRKVVKIVIEAPIEQAQQVIDALGFPGANEEQWLAVCKLDPSKIKPDEENQDDLPDADDVRGILKPETPQSRGGHARAESLSPEQRSEIARKAADTRWGNETPKPEKRKTTNAQLAGILCNDEMFWKYLTKHDWITNDAETAAKRLRKYCAVESRRKLDTDPNAARAFHQLKGHFELWRSGEVA